MSGWSVGRGAGNLWATAAPSTTVPTASTAVPAASTAAFSTAASTAAVPAGGGLGGGEAAPEAPPPPARPVLPPEGSSWYPLPPGARATGRFSAAEGLWLSAFPFAATATANLLIFLGESPRHSYNAPRPSSPRRSCWAAASPTSAAAAEAAAGAARAAVFTTAAAEE